MKFFVSTLALVTMAASAPTFAKESQNGVTLVGNYACAFTKYSGGETYAYPDFKCKITEKEGVFTLEKLTGSQRIKGKVTLTPAGFEFEGVYFCPWGDCTYDVHGQFETQKAGEFAGTVYNTSDPNDFTDVDLRRVK
ncbi:DUF4893 domain-containing protein [Vibrio penaeicida]|uniref:DUF4893 domain-containing protein n=1 Tax=Vibrio penaeicida TaxID=104609 RepID=UPI002732736D|nr:DUF4893 domain-containing protein [Vibrio penaeicida]MDP2572521.1 DUF4893 domain-containing protein [Vibrio penaeicida]